MRSLLGLSTVLLATTTLAAQSAGVITTPAVSSSQASAVVVQGWNCPVDLAASRSSGGGLVQTKPGDPPLRQGLYVTFRPHPVHDIVQVELTVRGLSGNQVVPAGEGPSAEASEAFTVAPRNGSDLRFTAVVSVKKITGVTSVELNSITYADGTRWQSSASSTCRVAPNGFRLVAEGK